jgi:hypothetical protein
LESFRGGPVVASLAACTRTQRGASAWLEAGEFVQTLITPWPSENTGGVDLGFDDCLCHYLGGLPLTL